MSFFAERDRPRPSENEKEQEHDNTELAETAIPQPAEILELLKSVTPGTEKLIAQQLKVQEAPARASQHIPEPGPSNNPRFTTRENSASPGHHETRGQPARRKRSRTDKACP